MGELDVTFRQTAELSNVVLNVAPAPEAFSLSRLKLPDGLKVSVHSATGDGEQLMVWYAGDLLTMDDFMTLVPPDLRRRANGVAPTSRP